jgi:lysophospholipase L1-like esterase
MMASEGSATDMSRRLERLSGGYRATAIVLLNTVLGFVLLNGISALASRAVDYGNRRQHAGRTSPVCAFYGDSLSAMYPGYSEAQIDEILDETWSRPVLYEPYVQFTERPFRGKYVNVVKEGYRLTRSQGPWPPDPGDLNVFLFGGSTIFNYGVADDDTVASFLQEQMDGPAGRRVRVYNFGRGSYYSTQERILFEKLLTRGFRPDLAIFVDGLNDFYSNADEPYFNDWFQQLFNDRSLATPAPLPIERLPIYQPARWLKHQILRTAAPPLTADNQERFDDPNLLDAVIGRYRDNKTMIEAIGSAFHVRTFFVWQPIPTYGWNLKYHLCPLIPLNRHGYARFGYERMARLEAAGDLGDDFAWCADIQRGLDEPLYVDDVHYSMKMSQHVAACVADAIAPRSKPLN